jgi:uncharacterized protein YndB with AHSA1/START domain
MPMFAVLFSLAMLLAQAASCHGQSERATSGEFPHDAATPVVNTITIAGAPEAVFDLVTTARFWPQWHPATRAVGGVVERPYRLGDQVYERGQIGNRDFQVIWKVVEWAPPSRVVLRAEKPLAQITYAFQARDGATIFTRELKYKLENPAAAASATEEVDRLMRVQSEQAVTQLKELVESILRQEAVTTP